MSRIILLTDVHLCQFDWYGKTSEDRLEKMISDLNEEHKKEPIDMILMLGDYSLDYWGWEPYGSYAVNGISNTKRFMQEYACRLPCPIYLIPGNHEQYTHETWEKITGFKRQFSVVYNNNLFLMLDTFGDNLDAPEHNDGTYSGSDVNYITEQMAQHPDKNVFLCSHYFYPENESEQFKALLKNNDRILALFAGHSHVINPLPMGPDAGDKISYICGQYSYANSFVTNPEETPWGYRELRFSDEGIFTEYIVPEAVLQIDGKQVQIAARRQDFAVIKKCRNKDI